MNKNGEERQVTDFWRSIRGASGPNGEKKNPGRCGLLHSSYPNCDVTFKGSRWPDKILILSTPPTERGMIVILIL